jgi:amidase
MPYFQQEVFLEAAKKGDLTEDQYLNALDRVLKANGENGIDKALKTHQLDAIIAPSNGPSWPIDLVTGDHFLGGSSSPAARSGYPSISVPAGFVHGLPIGISIFAGAFSEPELISMAYAYEQATRHRKPPAFRTSFDEYQPTEKI